MKYLSYLFNFLLLTVLFIGCNACRPLPPSQAMIEQDTILQAHHLQESTVGLIMADLNEDNQKFYHRFCSGVFISQDEILTAKHCTQAIIPGEDAMEDLGMEMPDEQAVGLPIAYQLFDDFNQPEDIVKDDLDMKIHWATVEAVDPNSDLALIKINESIKHDWVVVAAQKPETGSKLEIVGHPAGIGWSYIEGMVSGYITLKGDEYMHVTAPIYFGNSGGLIVNERGELVGIVSKIMRKIPDFALSVPQDKIVAFLQLVHKPTK